MTTIVFVPFVASIVLVAMSRVLAARLRPAVAVWALSTTLPAVAFCSMGALGVLASPLAARVPLVAAVGRWTPHAVEAHSPVAPFASVVSTVVLIWVAIRVLVFVQCLWTDLRTASAGGAFRRSGPGVTLVDDRAPFAHAVGVGIFGLGRIVVSSGLLDLLDHEERAAVIAHERAHLRQQHSVLSALARLSIAADPLLRPVARDLHLAIERSADEAAAVHTSRNALASGIAKAALAAVHPVATSTLSFGLHRHAVAARVAALLDEPEERTRSAWLLVALAAGSIAAITFAMHDTERFFEEVRVWSTR